MLKKTEFLKKLNLKRHRNGELRAGLWPMFRTPFQMPKTMHVLKWLKPD